MTRLTNLTLKHFKGVLGKRTTKIEYKLSTEFGFVVAPKARWAFSEITEFYRTEKLSGVDLNKTFHKSWAKIRKTSREALAIEQIFHYISTYESNFTSDVYIPNETLDVPDLELSFNLIHAFTKKELKDKALSVLKSGIALNQETIVDMLDILEGLDYTFKTTKGIRNNEALVLIGDRYNIYPEDAEDFMRYVIYKATGSTLVIKDTSSYLTIKGSKLDVSYMFSAFGLEKLARIFNRYYPFFMALKSAHKSNARVINKIAKLSKTYHEPLVENPLSKVTSRKLVEKDMHWLDNATPFALLRALNALHTRLKGQTYFLYKNRKGTAKPSKSEKSNPELWKSNYAVILDYLKDKYDFSNVVVHEPKDLSYAFPTSEKNFVGSVPAGTIFSGKRLAVGMYWENDWGASDLDLKALSHNKAIGWNGSYSDSILDYSGDITSARFGAVEYIRVNSRLENPYLLKINVFTGKSQSGYKLIVGESDNIHYDYMMNPNNLKFEVKAETVQKETCIGFFNPTKKGKKKVEFVVANVGMGHREVSHIGPENSMALLSMYEQYSKSLRFTDILKELGATVVDVMDEDVDIDLSMDKITIDTFINIFDFEKKEVSVLFD